MDKKIKAPLYSKEGKKTKDVDLNPAIFAARINKRLLSLVQTAYAANLRHGTADTKTRREVRGGGKKPWRQKGTGRARAGSIRSPIWRGGGTVFGPHPRSYFVRMAQGMRHQALIAALSLRAKEENLFLLEDVKLQSPKTKEWAGIMGALPMGKKSTLCLVVEMNDTLRRASKNTTEWVRVRKVSDVNAYHVLHRSKLIIEEQSLAHLEKALAADLKS